ncbi:MAG: metabolite traffic protein EboE [Ignavibacteriae bacterium]|nr:metabolite traffic protein EboE [Ignavibacteriota bacterium]
MLIQNDYHLTYCTNTHTGETWSEVFQSLKDYLPFIKSSVAPEQPFGVGLRLSNIASVQLLQGDLLNQFSEWLYENNLYVFTINGFPYGDFHGGTVKEKVYLPDWTNHKRVYYTKRLFTILARLLPKEIDGGISTVPISYKRWFNENESVIQQTFNASTKNILSVVKHLHEIHLQTGKILHLDIEPEPDCLIETTAEFISFFQERLLPAGHEFFKNKLNNSESTIEELIRRHVRMCYDICHQAVEFETPSEVFKQLSEAGISIGKIQITSALSAKIVPGEELIFKLLQPFAESMYLHQTTIQDRSGTLERHADLSAGIERLLRVESGELRTHFHVPIFMTEYGGLTSTQNEIVQVLNELKNTHHTNHFEVETYTWDVLPKSQRINLRDSIVRELQWVKEQFEKKE